MSETTARQQALRIAEQLPEDATWEDLHYQIYFRQAVEVGLRDSDAGRVVSQEEARRLFLKGRK